MLTATKDSRQEIAALVREASGNVRVVERALRSAKRDQNNKVDMEEARRLVRELLEESSHSR